MLVSIAEAANKTPSGLILPDASVEQPTEGIVTEVGWKSTQQEDHFVKLGDTVMLPKFGGQTVTLNGSDYRLIEEHDILGRVLWSAEDANAVMSLLP